MVNGAMGPTSTARVRPRGASLVALSASALLVSACATGEVSPYLVDDRTGVGADAGGGGENADASNGNGYQTIDSGKGGDDAGYTVPTPDASAQDATTGIDSAPPFDSAPPVDSAPPPPPATGDCTGTTSTQLSETYNDACDAYFNNSLGDGNPCAPGGNTCAALNGQGGFSTFCCYKPPSGTNCYLDYGGQAQCIPK